jgi:hypothetical protein
MRSCDARTEFVSEYGISLSKNNTHYFVDILNQHAIVMVDGAKPGLSNGAYIGLGIRLAKIQKKWIKLLCNSIIDDQCVHSLWKDKHELRVDNEYRNVVTAVIETFTKKLLEMMTEEKQIPYEELINTGKLHASINHKGQRYMKDTKERFLYYVYCLYMLYRYNNTEDNYFKHAVACLHAATLLGTWLDETIFK